MDNLSIVNIVLYNDSKDMIPSTVAVLYLYLMYEGDITLVSNITKFSKEDIQQRVDSVIDQYKKENTVIISKDSLKNLLQCEWLRGSGSKVGTPYMLDETWFENTVWNDLKGKEKSLSS